jgi:hypothetical protein
MGYLQTEAGTCWGTGEWIGVNACAHTYLYVEESYGVFCVQAPLEKVERFAFYERAKKAFAVVATG